MTKNRVERKRKYRSYEEYRARFYPKSAQEASRDIEDPYEFGVQLAERSLSRFRQVLKRK